MADIMNNGRGVAVPNMWIQIGTLSTSTAASGQVNTTMAQTQQLLGLDEDIQREVDPSIVGGLFASGELAMGSVTATIMREGNVADIVNNLATGTIISQISVFRTTIVGGKDQTAEQIDYSNCIVTRYKSSMRTTGDNHMPLYTATFTFRPTKRVHTLIPYDSQTGAPGGNKVSSIDFVKVALGPDAAPAGGGGGA